MSLTLTLLALLSGVASPLAHAVPVTIDVGAAASADAIFVHWVGIPQGTTAPDSMRVAATIEPFTPNLSGETAVLLGDMRILPMEATVSEDTTGKAELTRFKAALFRATVGNLLPTEVLTFYRDLDRGIEWGTDLLSLRVPIKITSGGEITVSPGLDLGVRHYTNDVTGVQASFVVDAKAVTTLIQGWLDAGILARAQFDAVTSGMSGNEESATGFLALALDSRNKFYMRVFGGVERDSTRALLNLPETATFVGAGIFGNFKGN